MGSRRPCSRTNCQSPERGGSSLGGVLSASIVGERRRSALLIIRDDTALGLGYSHALGSLAALVGEVPVVALVSLVDGGDAILVELVQTVGDGGLRDLRSTQVINRLEDVRPRDLAAGACAHQSMECDKHHQVVPEFVEPPHVVGGDGRLGGPVAGVRFRHPHHR